MASGFRWGRRPLVPRSAEPHTEPPAKVLDLVAALEASIAKSKTAKDRHPSGTGSRSDSSAKPAAAKRTTKSTSKSTKAPAKKAARAKRSA